MKTLAATLAFGFWLGLRHATDADHVVAVSTIVARTKRVGAAWLLGAFWGLGHTVTIFLVGVAIIVFRVSVPPRLGLLLEFAVGLALVALGALNLTGRGLGSWGIARHSHPHDHDDPDHHHELLDAGAPSHAQGHAHLRDLKLGWLRRHLHNAGLFQLARSAAVGLVHGLAGSAAVTLLVLAAIPTPRAAVLYLLIFGFGTLAGMLTLSALMELAMALLARWWTQAERLLSVSTGSLSLGFGAWMIYRICCIDGLFLAQPSWNPR